ncbi:MAG: hypothetical protein IPI46_13865 [Bacteroidetes bacterium]|nr:hypothetical protein [Bacteroidota bacterium]
MNKIVHYLILFLAYQSFELKAQTSFGVTDGAAKSTAGSSGMVSANQYTASSNVTIPIMAKKIDDIDLSLSLNYMTNGIKLNQTSSNIGLGWELSSIASISRVVRGIPDEFKVDGVFMGYWHRSNNSIPVNTSNVLLSSNEALINVAKGAIDGQMDIFKLSLNGMQVEFFINAENEIRTIPDNTHIKIERLINSNIVTTFPKLQLIEEIGFLVTDESGNKFYFKSGDKMKLSYASHCGSSDIPLTPDRYYASNWVIDNIHSYNGKQIFFNYKPYLLYGVKSDIYQELIDINSVCFPSLSSQEIIQTCNKLDLESIVFPDLVVNFIYRSQLRCDVSNLRALEAIDIIEKDNINTWNNTSAPSSGYSNSRRISFEQSYFSVDGQKPLNSCSSYSYSTYSKPVSLDYRLRLDKILDGTVTSTRTLYKFEYYDINEINIGVNPDVEQLPFRLSPAVDYWGYYTGNFYNTNSVNNAFYIPEITTSTILQNPEGIDREPNANNKLFSLKKVINENNGCTEFKYGLNQAMYGSQNMKLDGLRLDGVDEYTIGLEANTTKHITQYEYLEGEWIIPTSSTIASIKELFNKKITAECHIYGSGTPTPPTITANVDVFTNQFLGQLDQPQHGYKKVITSNYSEYKSKNIATNVVTTSTKFIGKTENYFLGLSNLNSHFTCIGSTILGTNYSLNTANILLPIPPVNTSMSGLILNPDNFNRPVINSPYTYKQYYINWVLGTPYKSTVYDINLAKTSETEQEYKIYVKVLNSDDYLNLNGNTNLYNNSNITTANCYPPSPDYDFYYPFIGRVEIIRRKSLAFINNSSSIQKITDYLYDNSTGIPRATIETSASNIVTEYKQFYNTDNNHWSANSAMIELSNSNRNKVIYSEVWKTLPSGGTPKLISASGGGYQQVNGKIRDKYSYGLIKSAPLTLSPIASGGNYTPQQANLGANIPTFEKRSVTTRYDVFGNPCESEYKGKFNSSIWDYYQDAIVASATNAKYSEIAYSSFESNLYEHDDDNIGLYNQDKGNWQFPLNAINFSSAITGNRSYDLSKLYQGNPVNVFSSPDIILENNKKYIVSFWKKNGNVTLENWEIISGTTGPITQTQNISFNTYYTNSSNISKLNDWTYCQAEFTATHPRVRVSGTALIDELRLLPADAVMSTSVFSPLAGKISECDGVNNILHYENNILSRESIKRDIKGNILSKSKSVSQENDN